jgi:galactonate dehydratase
MYPDEHSRRGFIGASAAGALAGFAFLQHAVGDDAIKAVEDKGSSIKISALKAYPVGGKVFVKIETSHKVHGWGEITGMEPKVAAHLAESIYELLDGQNPTRIEHLWQKLYRSHRDIRGGPFLTGVISAIDMALWDISGKLYGVPVYRLLGGPVRDKIWLYPTLKAYKVGPGGPKPWSGDPPDVEGIIKSIENGRKKVGPTGSLMYDAHSCLPPPILIQVANSIQPYDVMFIEEPAVPGNIEVFKRIKAAVKIPLACGERDRTIWGAIPYLTNNCIDILQPDCGQTGGISQLKKIATLAEAFTVPVAPHCTMSYLGLTASIHAVAAIPNFMIQEGYTDGHIMPDGVAIKNWELDKDGYASLPQGPGLGVEIDEAKMAEVAADPKKKFKWPTPKTPDGAVSDY